MTKRTVKLSIDFPTEQHRQIKVYCAVAGITMKDFIMESISNVIEENRKTGRLEIAEKELKKRKT